MRRPNDRRDRVKLDPDHRQEIAGPSAEHMDDGALYPI
jgi:hypothetical protein